LALLLIAPPPGAISALAGEPPETAVLSAEAAGVYENEADTQSGPEGRIEAMSAYNPEPDTEALAALISAAADLAAGETDAEASSLAALTAAVAAAEEAGGREDLTAEQIARQLEALTAAMAALTRNADLSERHELTAGEYFFTNRTSLWNFSNPTQPSMGHAAIEHNLSLLTVHPDGRTELRLFFRPLDVFGLTGYLQTLAGVDSIYRDENGYISHYDKTAAAVYSVYEGITDEFGPTAPTLWYPRELGLPVAPGTETLTTEVFVPVMDSVSPGAGTQLALLRLDWEGFDLSSGAPAADMAALESAVAAGAGASADAGGDWTAKSRAALAAAVEAGKWLVAHNAALTVTQEMADRRAAAIEAALAALLPVAASSAPPAATPGAPAGGGGPADPSQDGKYYVNIDLWHADLNKASMGNAAFERVALVITADGNSVIQIAAHPVEVSGYTTGVTEVEGADILDSAPFTTNTKYDGEEHEIIYLKLFELSLPDVSSQYLPTRIKVPYTPMDAVGAATDGWLEARFRINWANVKEAPADAELKPSEEIMYGNSSLRPEKAPAAALRDEASGVRLMAPAGVVPQGAELKVSTPAAGEAAFETARLALADIAAKFVLFDVRLETEGEETAPDGVITLSFPVPPDYDPARLLCYRINEDGTATLIKGGLNGDFYEVQLNRLSLYALAEGAAPPPQVTAAALPAAAPAAETGAPPPAATPAAAETAPAAAEPQPAAAPESEAAAGPGAEEISLAAVERSERTPAATVSLPAEAELAPAAGGGPLWAALVALIGGGAAAAVFLRRRGQGRAKTE
jgi:hypothetical protein